MLKFSLTILIGVQCRREHDLVGNLPGLLDLDFPKMYSGYFDQQSSVGGADIHNHYMFTETSSDPENSPIVWWLNGGPGASSLTGMFAEVGPYLLNDLSYTDRHLGVIRPIPNPYSWSKHANLLVLEMPGGTGFSYCGDTPGDEECEVYNDESTAAYAAQFLAQFLKAFSEFKGPLYIYGESYAGVYIPLIAKEVIENYTDIDFQGVAVGNGCVGFGTTGGCGTDQNRILLDFLYGHNQMSKVTYANVLGNCSEDLNIWKPEFSTKCAPHWQNMLDEIGGFYKYGIYDECYLDNNNVEKRLYGEPNTCGSLNAMREYLNMDEVKDALHIRRDQAFLDHDDTPPWAHYEWSAKNIKPIYHRLLKEQKRVMIYYGDTDAAVSVNGGEEWVNEEFAVSEPRRPWTLDGDTRVAGSITQFEDNNLQFVTVRGAGHMVPLYKPLASLVLFKNFLFNQEWKRFNPDSIKPPWGASNNFTSL